MSGGGKVVAGNWKMNLGPREALDFPSGLRVPDGSAAEILLFPPAISLAGLREGLERSGLSHRVGLGVQNVYFEEAGAYTGETSVSMAAAAGAGHVLVGHSERRHVFGETDADTARKVAAVLRGGLIPVLCVGENLDEREAGRVEEVILRQLETVLASETIRAPLGSGARFLLAYEPVWAIGTGKTATPEDASAAHAVLRSHLVERLGDRGREVPILYGGSVNPDNAGELMSADEVDGVLVGGASLDPDGFSRIIHAA
ncbi:MAG: triose-phosphate isomerase [Gemmatimonadales bacterium]|nr:MAG: triose-phosphate isomerase [Gemmatimonadales bacterium]